MACRPCCKSKVLHPPKPVVDLYQWASGVNLAAQIYADLWFWSQKTKARSLSDMLGLGIIMPSTVKQAMVADDMVEPEFQKLLAAQCRLANVQRVKEALSVRR